MLVAVDIGNTNIVIAIVDGYDVKAVFRIYSDLNKTSDEFYALSATLLKDCDIASVSSVVISSVVPLLTEPVRDAMKRIFGIEPIIVSRELKTGLIRDSISEEMGSDILANLAYGHYIKHDMPVMVVDFGTALTLSTVDKDGAVVGCAIAPGIKTAVKALFSNTSKLPQIELRAVDKAMGSNTEEAINGGIMLGYAGLVDSLISHTEKEIGERLYVIATGGFSSKISPLISRFDAVDLHHTIKGICFLGKINC